MRGTTKPRKYRIDIYWSEEDGLYLAEVPELPGCLTHGETVAEAAANAEEATEAWIETAEEMGRDVPVPAVEKRYSGRFVARLPRDLHRRLAEAAQSQGVSLNQYILSRLAEAPATARRAPLAVRPQEMDRLVDKVRQCLGREARGRGNARTIDWIASAVGLPDNSANENARVREAIRRLVFDQQVPIVASARGYFIAESADDVRAAARGLARRGRSIEDREHIVALLTDFLELQDEERTRESLLEASEELLGTE